MQLKQITEEFDTIHNFRALATAYEEISIMRMQQVRSSVLSTRKFMEGVSGVFYHVKTAYKHQIEAMMQKQKKKTPHALTFSTLQHNGREIVVLLSANTKLYGDIISKTFRSFVDAVRSADVDIVIVGSLGKELFDQEELQKKYTFFTLPDRNVAIEDLKPLVELVGKYQTVKVFYGRFENVVSQVPTATIISGQEQLVTSTSQHDGQPTKEFKFFFEPSLETILHFFETQLFSSFVKQTVHENELARYASRIKAMEESIQNIHNKEKVLRIKERRAKDSLSNKKQLAAFSGMRMWKKR